MKLRDADGWTKSRAANRDPYGEATLDFAERWADLMEARMVNGAVLAVGDVAKQTSHEADTEGITGFMYGCAVSLLSQVWEHGEALRRWHNLDVQLGDEGVHANASGGVLNPALLKIA